MEGIFGDVATAMITPFAIDGTLDLDGAAVLAKYLAAHGSDALVVSGTTGESPTLRREEKLDLFAAVVESVGDTVKVIAGTSSPDTQASVRLTEDATRLGVHGILAVSPYYSKPPQRGLVAHFRAIADATDQPVLLYDIPGRTSVSLSFDTYATLAEHPQIVGVKEATHSCAHVSDLVGVCGEEFFIYSGDDAATLPYLSLGACGVVSVASHVAGPQIGEMIRAYKSGAVTEARKRHYELLPLVKTLFADASPIPVKAAVRKLGLPAGEVRPPLQPIEADLSARLDAILAGYGNDLQ